MIEIFLDGCINHVISFNRNSIDVQSGNFTSWYENKVSKDQYEFNQNEKIKSEIERLKQGSKTDKKFGRIKLKIRRMV